MQLLIRIAVNFPMQVAYKQAFLSCYVRLIMDYIIPAGVGTHPCFFTFYNYYSKITNFPYTPVLVNLKSPSTLI